MQKINLVLINFSVQISFVSCRHFDEVLACVIGMDFHNKLRDYKLLSRVLFFTTFRARYFTRIFYSPLLSSSQLPYNCCNTVTEVILNYISICSVRKF